MSAGAKDHERSRIAVGFATRAIHGAVAPPVDQQPSSVPLFETSTWRFDSTEQFAGAFADEPVGYVYGRGYGNPTVLALERVVAELEQTESAYAFCSGLAAIHAVTTTLAHAGDRVVAARELYGGTYGMFHTVLPSYGIEVELFDSHDCSSLEAVIDGAALCYVETIANPICTVADLAAIVACCRAHHVPVVVDNTFASPYLCTPATLGADFVLHSATKYLGGHSDLVAGVLCCSAEARAKVRDVALEVGSALSPFQAWLCIRGLQTLPLRMERHSANAAALAELLASHRRVSAVHYAGLASHPQHAIAERQFRDGKCGGVLGFEVDGGADEVAKICDALELAWLGVSLGGPLTLVTHPASTTHRQLDAEALAAAGMSEGLVRVSVGLEDAADLLADFDRALG